RGQRDVHPPLVAHRERSQERHVDRRTSLHRHQFIHQPRRADRKTWSGRNNTPGRQVAGSCAGGPIRTVIAMNQTNVLEPPRVQVAAAAKVVSAVKDYGSGSTAVRALDHVDLDIPAGRFTAIMGPSGSGKSTLLHCLAGLDTLTSGRVLIGDVDLSTLNDRELTRLRRDQLGFVFQAFNLLPTLTAKENILLPLQLAGRKPDKAWVDSVVHTVGLGDRLKHRPSELSGGQQQRVAVARALASKPAGIFADEPTGNLDSQTGAELLQFLAKAVRQFGQTIVMVTHDPTAAAHAAEVIFLADGHVVDRMQTPNAVDVIDRMKHFGH